MAVMGIPDWIFFGGIGLVTLTFLAYKIRGPFVFIFKAIWFIIRLSLYILGAVANIVISSVKNVFNNL